MEIALNSLENRQSDIINSDLRHIEAKLKEARNTARHAVAYLKNRIATIEEIQQAARGDYGTAGTYQADQRQGPS